MNLRKILSSNLAAVALLSAATVPAWAEHETGGGSSGGGNSYASHFHSVADRAEEAMEQICKDGRTSKSICDSLPALKAAIKRGKVLPRERVFGPDKEEREAINNGVDSIELSLSSWRSMVRDQESAVRQINLSVHEHATLAKLEGSDTYTVSSRFVPILLDNKIDLLDLVNGGKRLKDGNALFEASDLRVEFQDKIGAIEATDSSALGACRRFGYKKLVSYIGFEPFSRVGSQKQLFPNTLPTAQLKLDGRTMRRTQTIYNMGPYDATLQLSEVSRLIRLECAEKMPKDTVFCAPLSSENTPFYLPGQAPNQVPYNNMGAKEMHRNGLRDVLIVGPLVKVGNTFRKMDGGMPKYFSARVGGYAAVMSEEQGTAICRRYGYRSFTGSSGTVATTFLSDYLDPTLERVLVDDNGGISITSTATTLESIGCADVCGNAL